MLREKLLQQKEKTLAVIFSFQLRPTDMNQSKPKQTQVQRPQDHVVNIDQMLLFILNAVFIAYIVHVISDKQQTIARKSNQLPLQRPKRKEKDPSKLLQHAKRLQLVAADF